MLCMYLRSKYEGPILQDTLHSERVVGSLKNCCFRGQVGGLYKLDVTNKSHQAMNSKALSIEIHWHQMYGHINSHGLLLL